METDSDYPDLLNIPCASGSGAGLLSGGPQSNSSSAAKGRKHPFLQRSDSTLCLGCPPLDPFDTIMSEALPLADQPHLLQPHSRREDLFGVPRQSPGSTASGSGANVLEGLPTRLGLSTRTAEGSLNSSTLILGQIEQIVRNSCSSAAADRRNANAGRSDAGEPGPSKKTYTQATEQTQPIVAVVEQQTDRAPIIVSPNNQPMETESNSNSSSSPPKSGSSKDVQCKVERSVIVRAGSSSSGSCSSENNVNKQSNVVVPEVIVSGVQSDSQTVGANEEVVDLATAPSASQEISAHETVEGSNSNSSSQSAPSAPDPPQQQHHQAPSTPGRAQVSNIGTKISHNILLGRWRLSLDLFGRVFMEDVGLEAGSIVSELGGFPVKEAKFRRDMEKLRSSQQKDITLSKVSFDITLFTLWNLLYNCSNSLAIKNDICFSQVERDRTQLLVQTMKELNTQYNLYNRRASNTPPLAVNRVKVTFKDEPGEGSGVARGFYTAIAEVSASL